MNKNSNAYIIIYATVMVVVVALVLAFTATALKPLQNANEENEMKGAILQSIGRGTEADKAKDKTAYLNDEYNKYIIDSYAVRVDGEVVRGDEGESDLAFELLKGLKGQYDKPADERMLPVFVSVDDSGDKQYIFPVRGAGLWGPIWGYVALKSDLNTILGVVLDHASETPGLGAEIATPKFETQFDGKQLFEGGQFVSIKVLKGGGTAANPHAVDAISGGTITSKAVEDMITRCLSDYENYIRKMQSNPETTDAGATAQPADGDGAQDDSSIVNDLNVEENE